LPGTVGSYYTETGTFLNTSPNSGFTIEAWVNYASFANSNVMISSIIYSGMLGKFNPSSIAGDFEFGATTGGNVVFSYYNNTVASNLVTTGTITTGSWNHLVAQGNTSHINLFINGSIQTIATGGTAVAWNGTPSINQYNGITIGQAFGNQGPNFAIAKARVLFGANTYTTTSFTPSPNLGPIPAGGTVAWQLESQYPLPTFPSIQDVTELPQQASSYGSLPTPVGGVTSNVLGPYSSYPSLDSIRFDGTGYIDYGNAASSALCSNIWNSAWTIEGWVYPTSTAGYPGIVGRGISSYDWTLFLNSPTNSVSFVYGGVYNNGSATAPVNTWTHVAATYDGTRSNVYVNGALSNSMVATTTAMAFTPTYNTTIGTYQLGASGSVFNGNLADVRVSNVARYTGSTYTVPTAPFTTDSNTLLLLKSLGGQVGTTLEVQGRGLNSTSLGATRTVQSYPPAPMSSYLLDTTSNTAVTYGQGKYVASASGEFTNQPAWQAFDKTVSTVWGTLGGATYNGSTPGLYIGSVTTVDTLGNSYAGEWLQLQNPISILLSSYSLQCDSGANYRQPYRWWILGSRDGINWTLVDQRTGITWSTSQVQTFTVGATQAYNYYRCVVNQINAGSQGSIAEWTLNGTEESLCVTSDAKVGVGIANPQRSLEVAGDLVVGGTISGGAGMGAFRNRIINGDMRIAQRGTSNVVTSGVGANWYMIDRFGVNSNFSSGQLTQTQQTLTASDTPYQYGFRYSWRLTANIALTSASYGYLEPVQYIEGYNIQDFNWGTSFGSPITVSFWFRTNLAPGLYVSFTIRGGHQYSVPFTVTGNGTWQYVTATIPPPPNGGSWPTNNTIGLQLYLGSRGLASYSLQPNTWIGPNYQGNWLDTNWAATAGNYIEFTGVQLEKGTVATPFEFRPYATELALCQRYFEVLLDTSPTNVAWNMGTYAGGITNNLWFNFKVTKRAVPTLYSGSVTAGAGTITQALYTAAYVVWTISANASNQYYFNVTSFPLSFSAEL